MRNLNNEKTVNILTSFENIKEGMVLGEDVFDKSHRLLIAKGSVLGITSLENLKKFSVTMDKIACL